MSTSGCEFPLKISKLFCIIQLSLFASCFFLLWVATTPLWINLLSLSVLIGCSIKNLLSQLAVISLWTDGVTWQINSPRGNVVGELAGSSVVTAWFIILKFDLTRESGKVISYTLFLDSMPKIFWRRLQVFARFGR